LRVVMCGFMFLVRLWTVLWVACLVAIGSHATSTQRATGRDDGDGWRERESEEGWQMADGGWCLWRR
jgi:hypothetical protein